MPGLVSTARWTPHLQAFLITISGVVLMVFAQPPFGLYGLVIGVDHDPTAFLGPFVRLSLIVVGGALVYSRAWFETHVE